MVYGDFSNIEGDVGFACGRLRNVKPTSKVQRTYYRADCRPALLHRDVDTATGSYRTRFLATSNSVGSNSVRELLKGPVHLEEFTGEFRVSLRYVVE